MGMIGYASFVPDRQRQRVQPMRRRTPVFAGQRARARSCGARGPDGVSCGALFR